MALTDLTVPSNRCETKSIRSNAGEYYMIGVDAGDQTKLIALKNTDPGTNTWDEQDSSNAPASDNGNIVALSVDVLNNQICVVYQRIRDGDTLETALFAKFDMGTDGWVDLGSSDYDIVIKSPDALGNASVQCIVLYGSTETIAALYADAWENVSGVKARVGISTSTDGGVNWTDRGYISGGGGAFNEYCPKGVAGDEGRIEMAYINDNGGNNNVMQRTMNSSFAFTQAAQDTTYNANATYGLGWPDYVGRTGAQVCMFPYNNATPDLHCLRFDSADAPSYNSDSISTDAAHTDGACACSLHYDGLVMRAVSVQSSDRDVRQHADLGANTWTVNGLLKAGTYDSAFLTIYDHGGPKLACVRSASGAEEFSENDIADTVDQLSDVKVGWNKTFHGPFYKNGKLYAFMRNTQFSRIVALSSSNLNPGDTDWAAVGTELHLVTNDRIRQDYVPTASNANNVNGIRGMWCVEVDDTIEVYCSQEPGNLTLSVFDTSTDTWTTRMEHITNGWATNFGAVSFGVISAGYDAVNGHRVLAANYHKTGGHAKGEWRVRIFRKASGGNWTNLGAGDGDAASTDYWIGTLIGPDLSGGFTLAYLDDTNTNLEGMYIDSSGTINSEFTIDTAVDTGELICGKGVIVDDTVLLPYVDASNQISLASWESGSSPTVTITADISDAAVFKNSQVENPQPANFFGLVKQDDGTPSLLYVSADDQDIHLNHDARSATVNQSLIPGITVDQMMSANWLPGIGFGFIYDDSDTATYGFITTQPKQKWLGSSRKQQLRRSIASV